MFSVSTRVRYGLRALTIIASVNNDSPVTLNFISEKTNISRKYLENIFTILRKGKIVRSIRGPEGGYQLIGNADDYTIFDIVKVIEGSVAAIDCIDDPVVCENTVKCGSRMFWSDLQEQIENFLKSKTLQNVLDEYFTMR